MTIHVAVTGTIANEAGSLIPDFVNNRVASRMFAKDATLWGDDAEAESAIRLGWVEAPQISRNLIEPILALKESLEAKGINRFVLCGMGGSSLAPEVITRTAGVQLTVLDSTIPEQIAAAFVDPEHTAVIVSSKSGSTVETDSHRRYAEGWFADNSIDPAERIVIVTDPGSPLDVASRLAGFTVFNADPNVGGRFSALTAFGLVPSGLAGADITRLVDDAEDAFINLNSDSPDNPAIVLAASIAAGAPLRDKVALLPDGTHIVGLPDWTEQLIAESLGKQNTGILPVVIEESAPELDTRPEDLTIVRLVADALIPALDDSIKVSGSLGEQFALWEAAVPLIGRALGINPFDQPDVESAKVAARALLNERPVPAAPAFTDAGIEARGTADVVGGVNDISSALQRLFGQLDSANGYLSIQAYLDRHTYPSYELLRDAIAETTGRPVTFGWGPRFLHSTGQYHKGGPREGVFLQITMPHPADVDIPGIPFAFGELVSAQASGDMMVLADHGSSVLSLQVIGDPDAVLQDLIEVVDQLGLS